MLRILILCISLWIQPAVFKNIEKHYDLEYERGIINKDLWDKENALRNAQNRNEGYSTEIEDDKKTQDIVEYKNTYYATDSVENKQSNVASSEDSTKRQKEENVTIVLLRIADAIEGLNKNLKGLSKDYPNRIPLHEKLLYRQRRDVSNDASNKTVEKSVEVVDGNVTSKVESQTKGQDLILRENKQIKVEDKPSKDNTNKNANIPIARTQDNESPTIAKDKITKDIDGASGDKKISGPVKNATTAEKTIPIKGVDTVVKDVNTSTRLRTTDAIKVPALRSDNQNNENEFIPLKITSTETKLRTSDKTKDDLKDITTDSSADANIPGINNSYAIKNSSAINDTQDSLVNIKVNITNGRRSYPEGSSSSPRIRQKLLLYLEDMFDELSNKVQPLRRVKIALSPDNSYRIGYIVANIDTLEIKLKRLKRNMYLNKDYWDDDKMIDLFDHLRVTNSVVSTLMDTLTSYLAISLF